jgi:hypothetical protein
MVKEGPETGELWFSTAVTAKTTMSALTFAANVMASNPSGKSLNFSKYNVAFPTAVGSLTPEYAVNGMANPSVEHVLTSMQSPGGMNIGLISRVATISPPIPAVELLKTNVCVCTPIPVLRAPTNM